MKFIAGFLTLTLLYLALKLAFGDVAFYKVYKLKHELQTLQKQNYILATANATLVAQVTILKHSKDAMEELARKELSMIAEHEILYYDI